MRIQRNFISMLVLALVGTAVLVNFARTAPMVLSAEESSDAYADLDPTAVGEEEERLKCPCPTEVEKTDCDEGLCSVGLPSSSIVQYSTMGLSPHRLVTAEWLTTSAAPEPDPPRATV